MYRSSRTVMTDTQEHAFSQKGAARRVRAWVTPGSSSVHYKESLCLVLRRALRYTPHCLDVMAVAPAACINYKWAVIEFLERLGGRFLCLPATS